MKLVDFLGLFLVFIKVFIGNELFFVFFLMFGLVLGFSFRRERRRLVGCFIFLFFFFVFFVRLISIFLSRGILVEFFLSLLILVFRVWIFRLALVILRCWIRRVYFFFKFWRRFFFLVIFGIFFFLVCWMFFFLEVFFFIVCFE